MEIFPAHHGEHRFQIAGCQTYVSQLLLFPAGYSQEIFNRELERDFPLKSIQSFNTLRTCMCLECIIATLVMEPGILLGGQNLRVSSNGCSPLPKLNKRRLRGFLVGLCRPHLVSVAGWTLSQSTDQGWGLHFPIAGRGIS